MPAGAAASSSTSTTRVSVTSNLRAYVSMSLAALFISSSFQLASAGGMW
jgi:hypothetical protein